MLNARRAIVQVVPKRAAGTATGVGKINRYNKIGQREVVGFGMNGKEEYIDSVLFPFPAIKYRVLSAEDKDLEEKAKGDWKKLTIAEKKQLYRISFCQTFEEMQAPTGEWKSVIGFGLMGVSLGLCLFLFCQWVRMADGLPESFTLESQRAQLRRMLDLQINPVDGISSKWDYERNMWKKDVKKE